MEITTATQGLSLAGGILTLDAPLGTTPGTFPVTISVSLTTYTSIPAIDYSFQVTIVNPCESTTIVNQGASTITDMTFTLGDSA